MSIPVNCTRANQFRPARISETFNHCVRFLPPADRELVEIIAIQQHGRAAVGRLLGISAGTVYRRFRRIVRRMCDPAVAALINLPAPIPADLRELGLARFLGRQTIRELARPRGITREEVRRRLAYLRGWVAGVTQRK